MPPPTAARRRGHEPRNQRHDVVLRQPGQGRCRCGALLCLVVAPSRVEVKCRRCGTLCMVELALPARPASEPPAPPEAAGR